jgi:hypothetical protein
MSAQLTRQAPQNRTAEPPAPPIPVGRRPLRQACHRIRLTIAEMNYASRRALELQAPWIVDEQWDRR